MPATPLHFLAIAPLYFKMPTKFDITSLMISSTFVDLELVYYFLVENHTGHGFWHSYFFVLTIYPIILSIIIFLMHKKCGKTILKIYDFFRIYPNRISHSFKTIYFSCLLGGVSHIFFDMWTHDYSSYVLYPVYSHNPFWIGDWSIIIRLLVYALSAYTLFLWIKGIQTRKKIKKQQVTTKTGSQEAKE